jgi:hypothetical protein
MTGHNTMEKRKVESGKNRAVAGSFRRETDNGAPDSAQQRLLAQKALDSRREETRNGLLTATATAIGVDGVTDMGDGQSFPYAVTINGGLKSYVDSPAVDEPIDGFSSDPEEHNAIEDPETWAVFCSRQTHAAAKKLLERRGS